MKSTELLRELRKQLESGEREKVENRILEIEREMLNLRFRKASMGEINNPALVKQQRRNLARIKTVLNEKIENQPEAS